MAIQDSINIQELLSIAAGVFPMRALAIASFSLFIYDYTLTFFDEVSNSIQGLVMSTSHSLILTWTAQVFLERTVVNV